MAYFPAPVTQCPLCTKPNGGEGVKASRELMLKDTRSIREGL